MTPEAEARINIDKMLIEAGYLLQDMRDFNRKASTGVAVREYQTNTGPVDYLLFVGGIPVGVIEAKAEHKGATLSGVAEQSLRYAASGLKHYANQPNIRFTYESTGIRTNFCDHADQKARTREVFSFHKPETLMEWLKAKDATLRNNLKSFPPLYAQGFRDCQVTAIRNLEKSFAENKPRALIQMATGAGKTFTAITVVYRLLKYANAKRVLFLVDTKNLGEQAEGEFMNYKPSDDGRLFSELYNVRRLNSSFIPSDSKVCVSTIQRMYSILRDEKLDESTEESNPNERKEVGRPRDVKYNTNYPPEFFDFIIIDECHRSIYNIWQQVLDYFDAFHIGLTATPDNRTFGFFHQNVVSEYTHEQAVLDGVNVPLDGVYLIETEIGTHGGKILKQVIEKRERLSRKRRWEQLDEDFEYAPSQLDRDVMNRSQIISVLRAFHDAWKTIFPHRDELPKTLVFAKNDNHAEDIIGIIREEFGEGDEFCKKVTYSAEDPKSILTAFRNDYYPRVAVTVDMIATGTDVKPIECLFFMRDVKSKNYFEQMLGRATRTLDENDLKKVSPSAKQRKLGYIIIDAVGVTKTKKTASRQLERKPTVSLKDLMMGAATGAHDEDTLTTLAGRLARLDKQMTQKEKDKFAEICQTPIIAIATNLLNAFDPDIIEDTLQKKYGPDIPAEKLHEYTEETARELADAATAPFNLPAVRDYIENVRRSHDQIIDNVNLDSVTFSGWDTEQTQRADETIDTFAKFIEDNKTVIDALEIIYSQSYRSRPLTFEMVKELHAALQKEKLSQEKLWAAYSIRQPQKVREKSVINQLADIISLVKYQLGQTAELNTFSSDVARRFQLWTFEKQKGAFKFNEEQMSWLHMLREHIATSMSVTTDDLDLSPFDAKGGRGGFYKVFGPDYKTILDEINYALIAA